MVISLKILICDLEKNVHPSCMPMGITRKELEVSNKNNWANA